MEAGESGVVATSEAPAPDHPDYAAVAEGVGTTDSSIGSISWLSSSRVPVAWVQDGFPSFGFTYPRSMTMLYKAAPEDVEIYEVGEGYVALGKGRYPELAFDFDSRDTRWVVLWDWPFLPGSVWFSSDGESWELMTEGPIEPNIGAIHDPFVIAERDGRYVLLGWTDSSVEVDPDDQEASPEFVRGRPMAWVSDDLATWERVVADFEKPNMRTDLNSVVATDTGWLIFGVRRTNETTLDDSRVAEWAAWTSPDGVVWQELEIQELLGDPDCKPVSNGHCIRIKAEPAPGGVAVYAYQWELPIYDIRDTTWTVLIGLVGG